MEIESAGCDCQGHDNLWDWVKALQDRLEELEIWREKQDAKTNSIPIPTE